MRYDWLGALSDVPSVVGPFHQWSASSDGVESRASEGVSPLSSGLCRRSRAVASVVSGVGRLACDRVRAEASRNVCKPCPRW